jgi:hypothetical protein
LHVGDVQIDDESDFPQLIPPFHFWNSSSSARRAICDELGTNLQCVLQSLRRSIAPYGLWISRELSPVCPELQHDPSCAARTSTLEEELLAHLYHPCINGRPLVSYGLDSTQKPYPVLCAATTHTETSRFVRVEPTVSLAGGAPQTVLTLSFIDFASALREERLRVRHVDAP